MLGDAVGSLAAPEKTAVLRVQYVDKQGTLVIGLDVGTGAYAHAAIPTPASCAETKARLDVVGPDGPLNAKLIGHEEVRGPAIDRGKPLLPQRLVDCRPYPPVQERVVQSNITRLRLFFISPCKGSHPCKIDAGIVIMADPDCRTPDEEEAEENRYEKPR